MTRGHEFYNFSRGPYKTHKHAFSLSPTTLEEEKIIFLDVTHSHYMSIYILSPHYSLNFWPRGHEFRFLYRKFHWHHIHAFGFSKICIGVEKKIFYDLLHFHYITIYWPRSRAWMPGLGAIIMRLFLCLHVWEYRRFFENLAFFCVFCAANEAPEVGKVHVKNFAI